MHRVLLLVLVQGLRREGRGRCGSGVIQRGVRCGISVVVSARGKASRTAREGIRRWHAGWQQRARIECQEDRTGGKGAVQDVHDSGILNQDAPEFVTVVKGSSAEWVMRVQA